MSNKYTAERNAQILISLLKQYGIKKIIASPGTTNIAIVASLQQDSFFEIYSAPDERSACYMACGMSEESGEAVALSCTGATASRNYLPGLTEAFYRKLPILAITSSRQNYYIGNNDDQVTDRTVLPNDVAKISVQLPIIYDNVSEWGCICRANKALSELFSHGGGPVHINIETKYNSDFSVSEIKNVKKINFHYSSEVFPKITSKEIGILVGSHGEWLPELVEFVDLFCEKYNGAVICDHISNYPGKFKILSALVGSQFHYKPISNNIKHIIHIGGITSSVFSVEPELMWRVSPDGEIRDPYHRITDVFEVDEVEFFKYYCKQKETDYIQMTLHDTLKDEEISIFNKIPELPFSNAWIASNYSERLPNNSVLHLGIRNSLRVWSYFSLPNSVRVYSNVGGFGIDGSLSSLIGASLADRSKLFFCVIGDLAFFYDMNSLGNRHVSNNIRIMLINNATGMEMKFSGFYASTIGAEIDNYISASYHYGNKSPILVKNYAESLGFQYYSAKNKNEFDYNASAFFSKMPSSKPIIFEVFIDSKDEDESNQLLTHIESSLSGKIKRNIKMIIGEKNSVHLKRLFN